ncbi:WSC-domain-containing protein [Amniculicola lignicola CBS 123094]|uniref:WSC-domain-containing protein n=1 Tax=Amniculicola lignicola CBS 123094 TaxID=1392246 RepID=A0A6A5WKJ9_9PLEO|nr:WSC-domain-containing protein [Amniculicola lignicola CBS 123094]
MASFSSLIFSTRRFLVVLTGILFASQTWALGDTDTITWGGDNTRAGYQTNHNMDPDVVGGPDFGRLFSTLLPGNFNGLGPEQIFSQPLVYTGDDGIQYVYVATTQNNIYKLDAETGAIVASRNLHVPFLQVELGSCVDINPVIGVTATGVIDPTTGIWYLTAKTYSDQFQNGKFSPQNPPGRLNGRYYQHAIHTEDLSEATNWPVLIDGTVFRNNPNRMFQGGNTHSRPGALLVGDYVYTGYASHCVQYNFTGAIIGFHKTTGKIIEAFATQGGPEPNTVKGGGIWMSGGGLAYDGAGSMYFATGNGYASQLKATGNSVPGRTPPTSLEEAAVNAKINADGTLTIIDFFIPWEKTQLDGADKDLGTTPLEILPSDTFSCPNHRRIGIVAGKSGKTYWLNLDNLGGYQMGPLKQDAVIQVFQNENSVYAGAGVLPLGGGYVYISVTQYKTHVFKFSCNAAGDATFAKVSDTPDKNAYILGTGHGTTTSLNGKEGTGLLWVSDVQGGNLRIYDPIPPFDGSPLTLLNSFDIDGVTKFTRPVFGDKRVYIGTVRGYIYGFGSPATVPLNCSAPYEFGSQTIFNASAPITATCTALIGTTVDSISLNSTNFQISNTPDVPLTLSSGQTFTFSAIFNASTVGPLSNDVIIETSNSQTGYSSRVSVPLQGVGRSVNPILTVAPNTVSFNVLAGTTVSSQSTLFWNLGDNPLTFTNISFSLVSETGPWITPNQTSDGNAQVEKFIFVGLPSSIPPASSAPITIMYTPDTPGNHAVYVKGFSNGGSAVLDVFGAAGTNPKAVFEFQKVDGSGWVPYTPGQSFTFGTVFESQTRNLVMRITNGGGSAAIPLSITISKPPYGIPGIIGTANNINLAEGTILAANQSATAVMYCSAPKSQVNLPSYNGSAVWVLNTGDPDLGKQEVPFFCTAAAEQVGPLFPNGTAQYGYVGCFKENNPGRQLATNIYSDSNNNTNNRCIAACYAAGYIFAGTQYSQECWCGNAIPIRLDSERDCNSGCTGNGNQTCGGDGYLHDTPHISLFGDSTRFNGNTTSPPLQITPSVGIYNFLACYTEPSGKALNDKGTSSNVMTVQICQAYCSGYAYFGLEFGAECYCGNRINPLSTIADPTQCNIACKGSNSQCCGAGSRMQIYQANGPLPSSSASTTTSSSVASSTSSISSISSSSSVLFSLSATSTTSSTPIPTPTKSSLSAYIYVGCYNEIPGRALPAAATTSPNMTAEYCAAYCTGYTFFAVEYAQECYCGTSIPGASAVAADGRCNMPCTGNSSEICGGPNGLSLYQTTKASVGNPSTIGNYTALGCYAEKPNGRSLEYRYANDSMTVELCAAIAAANGYAYFGLEYQRECWMDNLLDTATPAGPSRCSLLCAGNQLETCGGPLYLNLYAAWWLVPNTTSSFILLSSPSSPPPSSRIPTSSTSPSPTPSFPTINTYTYLACYAEPPSGSGRALTGLPGLVNSTSMTPLLCSTYCSQYTYFGLEFGQECWCGPHLSRSAPLAPSPADCNTVCSGDGMAICGGPARLSVYKSNDQGKVSTDPVVPGPVIGNYTYQACYADTGSPRILPYRLASDGMTTEACLAAAEANEYVFARLEYGRECWLGDVLVGNDSSTGNVKRKEGECGMGCGGARSELCGGGNRVNLWMRNV